VIDFNNHRVQRLTKDAHFAETIISNITAWGITMDKEDHQSLYLTVSSREGDQIVKYSETGEFQHALAGIGRGHALTQLASRKLNCFH